MDSEAEMRAWACKIAEEKVGYTSTSQHMYWSTPCLSCRVWTGSGFAWSLFVLVFGGIGLVSHGVTMFVRPGYTDRMAEREHQWLKGQG